MNHSASAEIYLKKPQSALINYKGNLSSLTLSSNIQSTKNQEYFDSIALRSGIFHKLDSIKKFFLKKPEKVKFDQILSNLDNINHVRFIKGRVELQESIKEKGFIDKESYQYFDIKTKGYLSPIQVNLDVIKGSIEAYLSFNNSLPNRDSYERKFTGPEIEIHSKFTQFIESKCYIGVYAKTNCLIEICFRNRKPFSDSHQGFRHSRKQQSKSQDLTKTIQQRFENEELRQALEQRVHDIKERKRSKHRLDFITLNKSLASTSLIQNPSFTQTSFKLRNKLEEVKKRKIVITEEKIQKLKYNLMRREIKKQAEDQAQEIRDMLLRRERLNKQWLVFVYFAGTFTNWVLNFKRLKNTKIQTQILRMKAYCIQRNFKMIFDEKFSFSYRIKAIARNTLTLYSNSVIKASIRKYLGQLQKCVKEITGYQDVKAKFGRFYSRWVLVQRYWKLHKEKNRRRFGHLAELWSEVAGKVVAKVMGKGKKKKKKNHLVEKINGISQSVKEKYLRDHILHCKKKFVRLIRKGERPRKLDYLIEEETLAKVIISFTESKGKIKKKLTMTK